MGISIRVGADAIVDILIDFIADLEAEQPGPQRIGGIGRFVGAILGRVHGHVNAIDDVPVGRQRLDKSGKGIDLSGRDRRQVRQAAPTRRVNTVGADPQDGRTYLAEHLNH